MRRVANYELMPWTANTRQLIRWLVSLPRLLYLTLLYSTRFDSTRLDSIRCDSTRLDSHSVPASLCSMLVRPPVLFVSKNFVLGFRVGALGWVFGVRSWADFYCPEQYHNARNQLRARAIGGVIVWAETRARQYFAAQQHGQQIIE